jgi:hypothetical protein
MIVCPNCKATFYETESGSRAFDQHRCEPPEGSR